MVAWPLSVKRPKPPPGIGVPLVQRRASRNEAASTDRVPSALKLGAPLIMPSKARASGVPLRRILRPELSPVSAARKSLITIDASTGWPRHSKRPVAPKLCEIATKSFYKTMDRQQL